MLEEDIMNSLFCLLGNIRLNVVVPWAKLQ